MSKKVLLKCRLISTMKRLTFVILEQHPDVTFQGPDDGDYFKFTASNGYEVISRSRLDIQSERIWLRGGAEDEIAQRSGSMVFPNDNKRDDCYDKFVSALQEWAIANGGQVEILNC